MAVYSILWNFLCPQKGDENEEIYIFTGLYILDELDARINIFSFIIDKLRGTKYMYVETNKNQSQHLISIRYINRSTKDH